MIILNFDRFVLEYPPCALNIMPNKQNRHGLQFNVSQLLKEQTGATRHYEINNQALGQVDNEVVVTAPLTGQVKLLRTGSDILVTGTLETEIEKSCGRCLEPFSARISLELEEQFYPAIDINTGVPLPQPSDVDEANLIDSQHTLDLSEVVRQAILLESDTVLYCTEDCRGICPHCGQNLNTGSCDCETAPVDMRWASLLQELKTED